MTVKFIGGRTFFLIKAWSMLIVGVLLISGGLISAIIYGKLMLFLSVLGIIALLNSWYWFRRHKSLSGKDISI